MAVRAISVLATFQGLCFLKVAVSDTGDLHSLAHGFSEMEAFESLGEACGGSGRLGLHGAVGVAELACGGNGAVEILACQNHGAVDEIAENGDKLVVVARLEVGPGEVIIFGLGSVAVRT